MIGRLLGAASAGMSPETRHNFYCDIGAACLFSLFNVVFNQFYMPIAIQQGATNLEVGLLAAAPALGLLLSPIWASMVERRSPKPFVILPNLIARLLIVVPAFLGTPLSYVLTALVFHMLMGVQAPAYAALITRIYQPELRGRLMAYVRVAMGVLMIPLSFLIGLWIDRSGPEGPLLAAAITGAVSVLSLNQVRETAGTSQTTAARPTLRELVMFIAGNRGLLVFFAATTFAGFGNILSSPLYQIIQVKTLQLSNVEIGIARMVYYGCLLTAYFVVGWAVDRFSPKRTLVYGIAAYMIVPLLYGLFGNYSAVLIGSGVQGIGDAIWDIGILAYVIRATPGREAIVFSLHLMLFGIRGSIAPLISTWLSHYVPISSLLLGASVCGALGTLVYLSHLKTNASKEQFS